MTNQYIGPFVGQMRRWQHANPYGSLEEFRERACKGGWIATSKLSEIELTELIDTYWFDINEVSENHRGEAALLTAAFSEVGGIEGLRNLDLIDENGGLRCINWLKLIIAAEE